MNTSKLRCWCEVNLSAIGHNLKVLRKKIGPGPKIMCLVKADAYGHGLVPTARYFETSDCQMLGCAHLQEGATLRKAGIRLPILLLSAPLTAEIHDILKNNLMLAVSSLDEAGRIAQTAEKLRCIARVHLKLNTGMNRLGAEPVEFCKLLDYARRHPRLRVEGVFSHYAGADSDREFTLRQWKLFERHTPEDISRHICNSAGILNFPKSACHIVRPGIAVYGLSPVPGKQDWFKPALEWKSRVTFVKRISKGTPVSYGSTFRSLRAMRVATVAVGYGDGLFRSLSNKGSVLVQGRRCRILGRVTMDQIVVDVTGLRRVRNGTEAVLLGRQKKDSIIATEMAEWAGTISYEILTHVTDRVPKLYIQ
ncbi:MAG: alanine racemase [Methylacidiphilales bacterium]|nr:alanine racemase [Candidatus Methylacidiphilales bacterium]